MMKRLFTLLLVLTFWACSRLDYVDLNEFETDLSEAVLRHMFDQLSSDLGDQEAPKIYFIGFGNVITQPRDAFIARFADLAVPVKKISQSKIVDQSWFKDRKSGFRGAFFQIAKIRQISDTEFQVEAAFATSLEYSTRLLYSVVINDDGAPTVVASEPYEGQLDAAEQPAAIQNGSVAVEGGCE